MRYYIPVCRPYTRNVTGANVTYGAFFFDRGLARPSECLALRVERCPNRASRNFRGPSVV